MASGRGSWRGAGRRSSSLLCRCLDRHDGDSFDIGRRLDGLETRLLCNVTPEFQCEDELWYRLRAPPVSGVPRAWRRGPPPAASWGSGRDARGSLSRTIARSDTRAAAMVGGL